jgi:ATP-dependent DNA helicase DinG
MSLAQQVSSAFSENGSLAQAMPDFRSRPQQQEMAMAIAEAIEQQQQLVAEAGTGTGKTYAYLVPALLSGGKVIVSTGTKTLQDQLFQRDLPAVREALKVPVSVAMLKGRANYLCHYHLQRASQEGRFQSREDAQYIPILQSFAEHSQTGDKAELVEVPEQATVWQQVTSTRDNCVGQDCQFYKQCFVMEARKQALAADVVVVNHHLFFADVMLRDEGVAELLPSANTVVFDEAHQLPEVAGLFFGEDISTSQLMDLARDSQMAYLSLAKDCVALSEAVPPLEKACRDFRLVFQFEGSRMPAQKAQTMKNFDEAFQRMLETLAALTAVLETQAGRDPLLEKCWQRGEALLVLLEAWLKGNHANLVRWVEVFSQSVQLHATPLSVADGFGKQLNAQPRAWIFTSATLAVKSDFSHYQSQMGLLAAQTRHWQSPFDYGQQALLYVPTGMPEPNSSAYAAAVAAVSLPVLQASRGRAFVLCTSLKAMREVHALLKNAFEELGLHYPLLMQGESNRTELLTASAVTAMLFW